MMHKLSNKTMCIVELHHIVCLSKKNKVLHTYNNAATFLILCFLCPCFNKHAQPICFLSFLYHLTSTRNSIMLAVKDQIRYTRIVSFVSDFYRDVLPNVI